MAWAHVGRTERYTMIIWLLVIILVLTGHWVLGLILALVGIYLE